MGLADGNAAAESAGRAGCDRGFGPGRAWTGYHHVVDHFAALSPASIAVEDAGGCWSYEELQTASRRAAALLCLRGLDSCAQPAPCWADRPPAPRPLAVLAPRGRDFVALCVGCWRLGLPVAALSCDMADKGTEDLRNAQVLRDLRPLAMVGDARGRQLLAAGGGEEIPFVDLADVAAALQGEGPAATAAASEVGAAAAARAPVSPESVLTYVYTGGTTKASKCVTVTHGMALWEAENYSIALGGHAGAGDRFLQYSSLYWGAAVFGQISIGLAVGGCVCFGGSPRCGAGDALEQLKLDVEAFRITILGVVPSQLRGAWPGGPRTAPRSLRALVVWADKCPVDLSRLWKAAGFLVTDLLIASEYWLALHSDCSVWSDHGVEKHIYRRLPTLDARFLRGAEDGSEERDAVPGEVGEMYLSGPTTSPGYVCPDGRVSLEFHQATRLVDGKAYLRTRDQLLLLPDGGLVYSGRADSMMKHGGQWMDADTLQDKVSAVPGVVQSAVLPGPEGIDVFVVLHHVEADAQPAGGPEALSPPGKRLRDSSDGESPTKRSRPPSPPSCVLAAPASGVGELPALPPFKVLARVRRVLPSTAPGGCRVHLCVALPLNAATGKINGRALSAQLAGIREVQQQQSDSQERFEAHVRCFYGAWLRLGVGLVCGPQVVSAAVSLSGGTDAAGLLLAALQLSGACLVRLLLLPALWAASVYLEERRKQQGGLAQLLGSWLPDGLSRLPSWVSLPKGPRSKWLPLIPASVLPLPWLGVGGLVACSYLGWAREHDKCLAFGFMGAAAAVAASAPWPVPADMGHPSAPATIALLGAATIVLSPRWREFVSYLAAAPGLFYQILPKYLADALEGMSFTSWRWAAALQPPRWESGLAWDRDAAVVDPGNRWDQVYLEGSQGKRYLDSIGIRVHLTRALEESESLAPILGRAAGRGAAQAGCPPGPRSREAGGAGDALAALVERICGGQGADALHGLDSMQAIQLAEAVRREFGKCLSVSDVLRCSEIEDLLDVVQRTATSEQSPGGTSVQHAQAASETEPWRIWLCGLGPRMCTVDWMVSRRDGERHLDIAALERAVGRLVERHAALRARNAEEQPMFDATYQAASLWQLQASGRAAWTHSTVGKAASASVFSAWPRSTVLPPRSEGAKVPLLRPTVGDIVWDGRWTSDEMAFWLGGTLLERHPAGGRLLSVCVLPLFKDVHGAQGSDDAVVAALALPPAEVTWYIYAVLDHGYCDGPTGLPFFADLLRIYAEEAGEAAEETKPLAGGPSEALAVLQQRLRQSLKPLPDAEHPNDDIFHDGLVGCWGWRRGYNRHIRFGGSLMQLLRFAAKDMLGCSVDVAWLTAISAAFLRMFPAMRRLDLYLIVTCRDGPGQETLIGYFSSRKLMPLEVGDPRNVAILGLSDMISTARRQRTWRRPRPFEKLGAIEVNIVSQAADGLPLGFREVRTSRNGPSTWDRGGTSPLTLRLDQTARDDWDFRLQSHDASFGAHWSTYYAQALGSVLVDMAARPTAPVVPSA